MALSAFNLQMTLPDGRRCSVEVAYQASKVFISEDGPNTLLLGLTSGEAKTYSRERQGEPLVRFEYFDQVWPLVPPTAFYDWLYLSALVENADLSREILHYRAFSDIAFNPNRSLNCQARSAATFSSLTQRGLLARAVAEPEYFRSLLKLGAGRSEPSRSGGGGQIDLFPV